jgi:hypothetical protein
MRKPLEEIKELVLQDIQTVGSVGIFDNIEMINRLNVEITEFSLNLNNPAKRITEDNLNNGPHKLTLYQDDDAFGYSNPSQQTIPTFNPVNPITPDNPVSPSTGSPVMITTPIRRLFVSIEYVAQMIQNGYRPILVANLSGIRISVQFVAIKQVEVTKPELMIALEMKMSSFLGDYGAGKTIKTFSLLPGEKTTISVRTYQQEQVTKLLAQNVLDSYSESSAEDLQKTIQNEVGHSVNLSMQEINTKTKNWKAGGSFGLDLGIFSIGGGGGGGSSSAESTTVNNAIQTQVNMLTGSASHHVAKSDSLRQIEINSETTSNSVSEYEETIVRELENINKSRVLNFVFRQLLQEFVSITHLVDVSFIYYGGIENRKSCRFAGLNELLENVLVDSATVEKVKNMIYTQLCSIKDYKGNTTSLIEKVTEELNNCINPLPEPEIIEYVRVKKDLEQVHENRKVQGIILDVTNRILRTPSLVVDALLGQGESLDCYNQKLQDAATQNAEMQNRKLEQALKIIDTIERPEEQAHLYKKVFTECCDVAQSGGCGCNEKEK